MPRRAAPVPAEAQDEVDLGHPKTPAPHYAPYTKTVRWCVPLQRAILAQDKDVVHSFAEKMSKLFRKEDADEWHACFGEMLDMIDDDVPLTNNQWVAYVDVITAHLDDLYEIGITSAMTPAELKAYLDAKDADEAKNGEGDDFLADSDDEEVANAYKSDDEDEDAYEEDDEVDDYVTSEEEDEGAGGTTSVTVPTALSEKRRRRLEKETQDLLEYNRQLNVEVDDDGSSEFVEGLRRSKRRRVVRTLYVPEVCSDEEDDEEPAWSDGNDSEDEYVVPEDDDSDYDDDE